MIVGQDFKILTQLGAGGMGIVYQGVDNLEREVAIKKLRGDFSSSADVAERFRREAKIQAQLNHPNLVHLYRFFQDTDSFYIVMEFVEGTRLGTLTPLSWQHAVSVFLQVLEGLEFAHLQGVLHRDLKPDNIMIGPRGEVKVMDFGIAHVLGTARQTREKSIVGTIDYMPPEQIAAKEIGPASDLYSLGVVLFEMVSGRLPFTAAGDFEMLRHHLESPPPKLRSVVPEAPEFLEVAVARALEKAPTERFVSCRAFADFLREAAPEVAAAALDSFPRRILSEEVERCARRIESLVQHGERETAARVQSRALVNYPDQPVILAAQRRWSEGKSNLDYARTGSEKTVYLRDVFAKLRQMEQVENWDAAEELCASALARYPDVPALRIASGLCRKRNTRTD
jgi:serine/threonine-protein kinase